MNIAGALAALTAPPTPQQAQSQTAAMKEADQKKAREGDEAFERMIRAELEKKKAIADATPLPSSLMPWLPNQVDPNLAGDDDKQSIEAAGALSAATQANARLAALGVARPIRPLEDNAPQRPAVEPVDVDLAGQQAKVEPVASAPTPIKVVVEPGLPPVQPTDEKPLMDPVPLVRLPQVVTGTAQQAIKDGQPITQLDFEITPPHVGPVNLSISLHEQVVNVQLIVPTAQAKQMLEGQPSAIAAILQSQNLTPGQIRIVTAASGKAGAGSAGQQPDQGGFGLMNGGRRRTKGQDDSLTAGSV